MVRSKKEYWTKGPGRAVLQLFTLYRNTRQWRPTVIALVVNGDGKFLVVRRNTEDRNWLYVQGEIEDSDEDPVQAAIRELWEEASVSEDMIDEVVEYLVEGDIPYVPSDFRTFDTGYTEGGSYTCVGIRLKEGCDISLTPPPGHETALLEYRWGSYDEIVEILRTQPGVAQVTKTNQRKCEQLLIPAMDAFFEHERGQRLLSNI